MRILRSTITSIITGIAIIAVLMFSGVTVAGAVSKTDSGNGALRIIYSGGLTGNIEPCG